LPPFLLISAIITSTPRTRSTLLLSLLSEYSETYSQLLDGKREDLHTEELAGGAKIRHVFHKVLKDMLNQV
jgi:Dynamin central region